MGHIKGEVIRQNGSPPTARQKIQLCYGGALQYTLYTYQEPSGIWRLFDSRRQYGDIEGPRTYQVYINPANDCKECQAIPGTVWVPMGGYPPPPNDFITFTRTCKPGGVPEDYMPPDGFGMITGSVSGERGEPLERAVTLAFQPMAEGKPVATRTDDGGLFAQELPTGAYRVSMDGSPIVPPEVEVRDREVLELDFVVLSGGAEQQS